MWNVFKIVNLFWLMASTYFWVTALVSLTPILVLVNTVMIISLGFLPIQIEFNKTTGKVAIAMLGLVAWSIYIDGVVMGIISLLMYMPVLYLIQLPSDYMKDLLRFCTKWYAVALGGALVIYGLSFVMTPPSIGQFVHPNYPPFINHILYIKTTFDYGTFERFNAFFLEPGHQALLSSFLMMANSFDFRRKPYLIILALGVVFSFSLAGYILSVVGFLLLKTDTVAKLMVILGVITAFVVAVQLWNGGDNTVNELIISRLEYDESRGIKGNNRFFDNTDFEYKKALTKGDYWVGIKEKANMDLVGGAGFKIYILKNGLIGVIFVLLFYLSIIPPHANIRYTASFLIVLTLCFVQRSYPSWYSWLLPYVLSTYIHSKSTKKAIGR